MKMKISTLRNGIEPLQEVSQSTIEQFKTTHWLEGKKVVLFVGGSWLQV
jgi:hypothetical protein